jgi:hypothetical protein
MNLPELPYKQVEPSVYSQTIQYFSIQNTIIIPFTSATVSVSTFDQNKQYIYNRILTMTKEEYLNWNNNDIYLLNWICSKLGLTLINPVPNVSKEKISVIEDHPLGGRSPLGGEEEDPSGGDRGGGDDFDIIEKQ